MAKVVVSKNGPYLVSGSVPLAAEIIAIGREAEPEQWIKGRRYPRKDQYALCRCGKSKNKPFCDGTHVKVKFTGRETAGRKKYADQAATIKGPGLVLTDAQALCASARFCHPGGGTWKLTLKSRDPRAKKLAKQQACNCPSGRLVARDAKTGKAFERNYKPSISLVQDPQAGVSGPLWIKGKITVESQDARRYEKRNRLTLCRCGASGNKPFCDGSHIKARFNDGDASLRKKT